MSYYKNKSVARKAQILETINFQGFAFTVYRSTEYTDGSGGNVGASLKNGRFGICAFLNVETGELMIGQNATLAPIWPQVKASIIRHGGGSVGKVGANVTHAPVVEAAPAQVAEPVQAKRGPGRPRRVTASEVQGAVASQAPTEQPDVKAWMTQVDAKFAQLANIIEVLAKRQ